jgi:hypothetical protein
MLSLRTAAYQHRHDRRSIRYAVLQGTAAAAVVRPLEEESSRFEHPRDSVSRDAALVKISPSSWKFSKWFIS